MQNSETLQNRARLLIEALNQFDMEEQKGLCNANLSALIPLLRDPFEIHIQCLIQKQIKPSFFPPLISLPFAVPFLKQSKLDVRMNYLKPIVSALKQRHTVNTTDTVSKTAHPIRSPYPGHTAYTPPSYSSETSKQQQQAAPVRTNRICILLTQIRRSGGKRSFIYLFIYFLSMCVYIVYS